MGTWQVPTVSRRLVTQALRWMPPGAVQGLKRLTPERVREALVGRDAWAIGLVTGRSPLDLDPIPPLPLLTAADASDIDAAFVADPFAFRDRDRWWLFFEALDKATRKGVICAAHSDDLQSWSYDGVVLREPFHLSYPYIFEWQGRRYMVPETAEAGEIRLYEATDFPFGWSVKQTLLEGRPFRDASLLRHGSRWWMFTETDECNRHCQLRLYSAPEPTGSWTEHPSSPIVPDDPHIARPAGRPFVHDGKLYRLAQDCASHYGEKVRVLEVTTLSPREYAERELEGSPLLVPGTTPWSRTGTHHLEPFALPDGSWIAFMDAT